MLAPENWPALSPQVASAGVRRTNRQSATDDTHLRPSTLRVHFQLASAPPSFSLLHSQCVYHRLLVTMRAQTATWLA